MPPELSSDEKKELVRQFVAEVWNSKNAALGKDLLSPDYRVTFYGLPTMGYQDYLDYFPHQLEAWPDVHVTVDDLRCEGDMVTIRYQWTAHHMADAYGIPKTGRQVLGMGMAFYRVRGDKIVEGWICEDMLSLFRQLGAIPAPQLAQAQS